MKLQGISSHPPKVSPMINLDSPPPKKQKKKKKRRTSEPDTSRHPDNPCGASCKELESSVMAMLPDLYRSGGSRLTFFAPQEVPSLGPPKLVAVASYRVVRQAAHQLPAVLEAGERDGPVPRVRQAPGA